MKETVKDEEIKNDLIKELYSIINDIEFFETNQIGDEYQDEINNLKKNKRTIENKLKEIGGK